MIRYFQMQNILNQIGKKLNYFLGALIIVPWILFLICYVLNPKWLLTRDALSSFGDPSFSQYPWVYNVGLGIIAVLIFFMSIGIVALANNKIHVFGGAFWFVAGMFLALIGYYHGGTYPHNFVSTWFFIQAAFAIYIMGLGAYVSKDFKSAIVSIALVILMALGSIFVRFPSAATIEIFEIVLLDAWALFTIFYTSKSLFYEHNLIQIQKRNSLPAIIVCMLSLFFFFLAILIMMFAFL